MMDELLEVFGEMLKAGNKLYVLPVYDAGGTADRSVNSDELVERLKAIGVEAKLVENTRAFLEAVERAKPAASKGKYIRSITISRTMGPGIRLLSEDSE